MKKPALGAIELKSIASGIVAADAILKKANVEILAANPICPGKYMLLFAGEVADVEESLAAGVKIAKGMVVNELFLPYLHEDVIPAISGATEVKEIKALGIIETFSIISCVLAADKAAKVAPIKLMEIRLANGIGGKGYFIITGELADVEASMAEAKQLVKDEGLLAGSEIIASPHAELIKRGILLRL